MAEKKGSLGSMDDLSSQDEQSSEEEPAINFNEARRLRNYPSIKPIKEIADLVNIFQKDFIRF